MDPPIPPPTRPTSIVGVADILPVELSPSLSINYLIAFYIPNIYTHLVRAIMYWSRPKAYKLLRDAMPCGSCGQQPMGIISLHLFSPCNMTMLLAGAGLYYQG